MTSRGQNHLLAVLEMELSAAFETFDDPTGAGLPLTDEEPAVDPITVMFGRPTHSCRFLPLLPRRRWAIETGIRHPDAAADITGVNGYFGAARLTIDTAADRLPPTDSGFDRLMREVS